MATMHKALRLVQAKRSSQGGRGAVAGLSPRSHGPKHGRVGLNQPRLLFGVAPRLAAALLRVRPMVLGEEVEAPTLGGCAVTARDLKLSGEGGVDPLLLIERGRKRRGRRELSMPRLAEHIVPLR